MGCRRCILLACLVENLTMKRFRDEESQIIIQTIQEGLEMGSGLILLRKAG